MAIETTTVKAFHNVFAVSDLHASETATIDLACMLVAFTDARVIVEAGTYAGHMTLALANILRLLQREGKVFTADPIDNLTPRLEDDAAVLAPYVHYHQGDFLELLNQIDGRIDFAYIDASAKDDPGMRRRHFQAAYSRLRPGGLALIDDTGSPDWPDAAWFRDLARQHGLYFDTHRGLTIIQKDVV